MTQTDKPDSVTAQQAGADEFSDSESTAPFSEQQIKAANRGLETRSARFFSWLGNHFFAVTLVLTALLMVWAIGMAQR